MTPIIAFHFPEASKTENTMHKRLKENCAKQAIRGSGSIKALDQLLPQTHSQVATTFSHSTLNFSAMKFFNRFRKLFMRLMFSMPSRRTSTKTGMVSRQRNHCERFEPPKTSCSSYYSSHSHYNEAIADCIEFFNKSSQESMLDGRNSDVDLIV